MASVHLENLKRMWLLQHMFELQNYGTSSSESISWEGKSQLPISWQKQSWNQDSALYYVFSIHSVQIGRSRAARSSHHNGPGPTSLPPQDGLDLPTFMTSLDRQSRTGPSRSYRSIRSRSNLNRDRATLPWTFMFLRVFWTFLHGSHKDFSGFNTIHQPASFILGYSLTRAIRAGMWPALKSVSKRLWGAWMVFLRIMTYAWG